jgi:hypothetical protein
MSPGRWQSLRDNNMIQHKLIPLLFACLLGQTVWADDLDKPVPANKSETYQFLVLSDIGYTDGQGRQVIDVIEGSQAFLALSVATEEGQPVLGVEPEFNISGTSVMMAPSEAAPLKGTDESGILEFGVVAGVKGMDKLTVSYGENVAELNINIISLDIHNFAALPELDDGLKWSELMQATLDYQEEQLVASFPASLIQQAGEQVDIVGYMLPLDADTKQKHFLLTSSPPSCFYHIPGGPAGVVEVFSDIGIEASWTPITITGELVLVETSKTGVIYQLEGAIVKN